MKYAANEQGVQALRTMAQAVIEAVDALQSLTMGLQSVADSMPDLGPHKASLDAALADISESLKQAVEPAKSIAEKLEDVAEGYEDVMANDQLKGKGGSAVSPSGGAGIAAGIGSILSGIAGSVSKPFTGEGGAADNDSTNGTDAGGHFADGRQISHRAPIADYPAQVAAVQEDVRRGSGREISSEEAGHMVYGVQSFSGTGYSRIREAYSNPGTDRLTAMAMRALDDYIRSAPKWKGTVYRGINVNQETARKLLSGEPVDMLGPSSWSSDIHVAERFSDGYKEVRIVFVLPENKSGASITHLGFYGKRESEVTAPSGIKYHVDGTRREKRPGGEIIFIHVHE